MLYIQYQNFPFHLIFQLILQHFQNSQFQSNSKTLLQPTGSKFPRTNVRGEQKERYNYMNYKNDELEVEAADLKRRKSTPAILIGTQQRVTIPTSSSHRTDPIKSLRDPPTILFYAQKSPLPPSSPLPPEGLSRVRTLSSLPPPPPIWQDRAPTSKRCVRSRRATCTEFRSTQR